MERDTVKEFVVELLESNIAGNREDIAPTSDLKTILKSIKNEVMLNKTDASTLADLLDLDLGYKLDAIQWKRNCGRAGRLVLDIDDLQVYAEAWSIFCRPGTYEVSV